MIERWLRSLLLMVLFAGGVHAQGVAFEDVQILERNRERIKAMGDLRGEPKLMSVIVRFRERDVLISGNDYRYGYLTVVPYEAIESLMFSDIDGNLPKNMRKEMPLFLDAYAGKDQRWFQIVYDSDGTATEALLMVGRDIVREFAAAVEDHSKKPVVRYIDGLTQARSDAAFRGCRIFQTMADKKGRSKTDDFACVVLMADRGFVILGTDKKFQDRLEIAYSNVRELAYEHSKASSYMGRMPGLSAFKKEKHWFVIDHALPSGKSVSQLLLLDERDVADFRDAAALRTGKSVKTYALSASRSAHSVPAQLPAQLDVSGQASPSVLMTAQTIQCTLGPGYRAAWENQTLTQQAARFDDALPDLVFEQINLDAQTAQVRRGEQTYDARVIGGVSGLTFLVLDTRRAFMVSVFEENGRFVCVYSRHQSGEKLGASQFYGAAKLIQ